MLRQFEKHGNYNVNAYPDPIYDKNREVYHLVTIDKFTATGTYIGMRCLYFSDYAYLTSVLNKDNVDSLWELPENTKVVGSKTIWQIS